jgi:hypothetical protein
MAGSAAICLGAVGTFENLVGVIGFEAIAAMFAPN